MKNLGLAALAVALMSSGAYAADVYGNKGGLKDGGGDAPVSTKTGFYVSGSLGLVIDGDRSVTQRTHRENGDLEDGEDPDGDGPLLAPEDAIQVPDDISGITNKSGTDLDDVKIFGAEVSYLWQIPGRSSAVELGLAGTFYRDSESTHAWTGFANFSQFNGDPADFASPFESAGFVKVDRKYDIDLVLKAHYFLRDSWSVYAGGGLSYAKADINGASGNSLSPLYDNEFKNSETSFGYVLVLGTQYWVTENIVAGLEYNYKEHSFDLGGGTTRTGADSGPHDYTSASDRGSVDDRLHAVKGKVGLRF